MRPFNLDEYLKDPSKKVVTREGGDARILCTDRKVNISDPCDIYPIVALFNTAENREIVGYFTEDGRWMDGHENPCDLFFASEKKEGWINIYKDNLTNGIYQTEEEALNKIPVAWHYITTIKIEWEE